MKSWHLLQPVLAAAMAASFLAEMTSAQVNSYPFTERFDSVAAPTLPVGWTATLFTTSASTARSSPNAVSATGNTVLKTLISPIFNFAGKFPDKLTFYERRSGTAAAYRFEVRVASDGVNFNTGLALFDTVSSTTSYVLRTIDLASAGLQNQPTVKFRWQILNDNTNNTGVLRIDDVSLTLQTAYDLSVSGLTVLPSSPTSDDALTLGVLVKNIGIQAAASYTIDFFRDANGNGVAEASEKFATRSDIAIPVGDSLVISAVHIKLRPREYKFLAVANLPNDENRANDTAAATVSVGYARSALVVNELMYAPDPIGDEPEWVELFNPSSTDTVNLKNWRVSDLGISTKTIVTTNDLFIPPGGFAIVAKDANFSLVHPNVVAPVLVANFSPLNNTTPDALVLYDFKLATIDSAYYEPAWGGGGGKSLERIDDDIPATGSPNWGTSEDSLGRTPGRANSIVKLPHDLALDSLTWENIVFASGVAPRLHAWVTNHGKDSVSSFSVAFFADTNRNHSVDSSEFIERSGSGPLAPAMQSEIQFDFLNTPSGATMVIAVVEAAQDQRLKNNSKSTILRRHFPARSLVINELMVEPLSGQNEWIEFFNPNSYPVDVAGWKFSDRPTGSGSFNSFTISNVSVVVQPQSYLLVAADSTILTQFPRLSGNSALLILNRLAGFSFNADGDAIDLLDLMGETMDSVAYLPSWHNPDIADTRGRSLERITASGNSNDGRNWSTCVLPIGGTPGLRNSVNVFSGSSTATLSFSPNPFSPDGDGLEDVCLVRYNLPFAVSTIHIRIFDIKGRLIRTLANAELVGASGEIVWDGFDDGRNRLRIGVYIVFLEATESGTSRNISVKGVTVVAR
jgi:hypothetical protein